VLRWFGRSNVGRIAFEGVTVAGLAKPLPEKICLFNKGQRYFHVHLATVSSFVAEHAQGVEFLKDGVADDLSETGRTEPFEKSIA
jgi:hypothetical protein